MFVARLLKPQLTSPRNSNPFLNDEERQSSTELGLEAIAAEAGRRTNGKYLFRNYRVNTCNDIYIHLLW